MSRRETSPALPEPLRDALLASPYFAERGADSAETCRSMASRFTAVYQVRVRFGGDRGGDARRGREELHWVKEYLRNGESAEKELRFLREAEEHFRDLPRLRCAEPVAHLAGHAALVTRDAPGETLSGRLRSSLGAFAGRASFERGRHACRLSGTWLGRLHGRRAPAPEPPLLDVGPVVESIAGELERLAGRREWPDRHREEAIAVCRKLAERAPAEDLARRWTHGDYTPHNVLVSGEGDGTSLVIIDPSFHRGVDRLGNHCSRCVDLARFGIHLRWGTSRRRASAQRVELVRAFLEGYAAASGTPVDPASPALALFTARYLLKYAAEREHGTGSRPSAPRYLFEQAAARTKAGISYLSKARYFVWGMLGWPEAVAKRRRESTYARAFKVWLAETRAVL